MLLTVCLALAISVIAPIAVAQAQAFNGHGWPVGNKCRSCHIGDAAIKFRHRRVGFFAAKHAKIACARCHANDRFALSRAKCWSCHRQTHGPKITRGCRFCHRVSAWRPAKPAHRNKLSAGHNSLRCRACHKNGVYTGLNWACTSCHSLKHSLAYSPACASCHGQTSWGVVTMNHAATTGDCSLCHQRPGGHSSGNCNRCHTNTASWVANLFVHPGIPEHNTSSFTCSKCHPLGYATNTCLSCHPSGAPQD